jgi:hypothetical protein
MNALKHAIKRIRVDRSKKVNDKALASPIPKIAPVLNQTNPNSAPNCNEVNSDLVITVMISRLDNKPNLGMLGRNANEKNKQTPNQLKPVTNVS